MDGKKKTNAFKDPALFKLSLRDVAICFSLLIVDGIVIALGYFFPLALLLAIPAVLLPFLFSAQISFSSIDSKIPLSNRMTFGFVATYFSPSTPFFGSYRFFNTLWKSILVFIGISLVYSFCYVGICSAVDSTFQGSLAELQRMMNDNAIAMNQVTDFISQTPSLQNYEISLLAVSSGLTAFFFIHCLSMNSISLYIRSSFNAATKSGANVIFSRTIRDNRGSFYRDYYHFFYLGVILVVVGFISGSLLSLLWTRDALKIVTIGIGGILLFTGFYLPYFFRAGQSLFMLYANKFSRTAYGLAKEALEQMKMENAFTEEQIQEMEKKLAPMLDDVNKDKDDSQDDDKNKKD